MKKRIFLLVGIATVILFASCATGGQPSGIAGWIKENGDKTHHAIGISTIRDDESDAFQEAQIMARQNLVMNLDSAIVAIVERGLNRATTPEEQRRLTLLKNSSKQIASQRLSNSRMYGPVMNNKGNTYVIAYLDKNSFDRDINSYVQEFFAATSAELDRLLAEIK